MLDGKPLGPEAWSSSRTGEARPERGRYSGTAKLTLSIAPPRAGEVTVAFPPFSELEPSEGSYRLRSVEIPKLAFRVRGPKADASVPGRAAPDASAGAGSSETSTAPAARGKDGGLAWPPSLKSVSATWDRGEKAKALAELCGILRRAQPLSSRASEARKAALACAALLGTGAPMLDPLPAPSIFALASLFVALLALSLFLVSRFGVGKRGGRPWRGALLHLAPLLALSLALAFGALASAGERRQKYAVIWADSLYVVPSDKSELRAGVARGTTARLRVLAGDFAGLSLADGIEGWARLDSLYWY
jgi:hypothetical protein